MARKRRIHHWELLESFTPTVDGREGVRRSYRARNLKTGNEIALTLLDTSFAINTSLIDETRAGVEAYRALGPCDGLLEEVDCLEVEGHLVVTNSYLHGAYPIRHFVRIGYVFTEVELVDIARRLLRSLRHGHARGVVFGAINDVNVLYQPETGRAFLAALPLRLASLSKILDVARFLGVPYFHAPEVVLDNRTSPLSDLYGLCMVLYQMCAGRVPHLRSLDVGQTCLSIVNADVPRLPADTTLSRKFAQVIHEGLTKDPARRVQSADELLGRLDEITPRPTPIATNARITEVARTCLPYPIARHLHLFENVDDVGFRITQLGSLADAVTTFCAILGVGELRRLKATDADSDLLRRPSLGQWLEIARGAHRALLDDRDRLTCPPMIDLFFKRSGKLAPGANALGRLVTWRNRRLGHARQSDLEDVSAAVQEGRAILKEVLRELAFLSRYRLIHVRSLEYTDGRFVTHLTVLEGPSPRPRTEVLDHPLPCGEVLLTDGSHHRVLSLHEFVRYESCPECHREELFVYQLEDRGKKSFLGFHRGHRLEM